MLNTCIDDPRADRYTVQMIYPVEFKLACHKHIAINQSMHQNTKKTIQIN